MAKLDRDGVKIHYEIHGSGPTLLLSHGYSSTARMWDGQIAALKDR
jgi:pimeloyl-ACP methyl ester carboxylesterase